MKLLINAMLEAKSKAYLIDGFPRALDQAKYFEENVLECQTCIFYDIKQEVMVERCMKRAETSGRSDDNEVTIKNRIQKFFDESVPVVDFYRKFGKVRTIDASGGIGEVYAATKQALMP